MLARRGFRHLRSWTHGVDTQLFPFEPATKVSTLTGPLAHPVCLYVGRVSYEKNIEAFLQMETPGTKVVCGVGPLEAGLRARYPHVRWLGILDRTALAEVYASADVFVFPSRSETFGLVMLEAMACGTPVAAFPVEGPREVLGAHEGAKPQGGCWTKTCFKHVSKRCECRAMKPVSVPCISPGRLRQSSFWIISCRQMAL